MAWGFSLDPGELTFRLRPDNALVVRGDRPDIQMSALATSMTCIICTEGLKPLEYIMHEAEDEGTVLLLVEPDTLDVMDRLGSIQSRARFDHPRKLARFVELLEAHVNVPAIEKALEIA
jgi:BioD-like phosphotransacetylase family protein